MRLTVTVVVLISLVFSALEASAVDLLPDLFSWDNEAQGYMHDGQFNCIANCAGGSPTYVYRFSVAIPNIGDGPFELREETDAQDTQTVFQRIYDDQGGPPREQVIGVFENVDPDFGHLNLEGLAQYNLRLVTPGGGVGALVSSNDKTSHGVVDSVPFNTALPGAPASPVYTSIQGEIMGISIGHADLYSRVLTQQWVVVTGLPDGMYWLETVIDPYDRVLETDNTNNTTRVLVDLTMPVQNPEFLLGDFNDNGVLDAGDYTVWRDNVGAGSILPNDTTPGTVDGEDLAVWQHFFADANGTNTIALPEPAGHALCLLMVTTILPRGRR